MATTKIVSAAIARAMLRTSVRETRRFDATSRTEWCLPMEEPFVIEGSCVVEGSACGGVEAEKRVDGVEG